MDDGPTISKTIVLQLIAAPAALDYPPAHDRDMAIESVAGKQKARLCTLATLHREPLGVGSRFPVHDPVSRLVDAGRCLHVTPARARSCRRLCGDLGRLRSTVLRFAESRHR